MESAVRYTVSELHMLRTHPTLTSKKVEEKMREVLQNAKTNDSFDVEYQWNFYRRLGIALRKAGR